VDIAGYDPAPEAGGFYDRQADAFQDTRPAGLIDPIDLPPEAFWFDRITDDERGKMWALGDADGGGVTLTQVQRGRLKAWLTFTATNPVPLDGSETAFILGAMESKGVLDAGRADQIRGL
jgi:hypothetical protein